MPRAVYVYKKTRSLTHDLKPPKHPQMQMKQQLKTAYRVSNQVAKERNLIPKDEEGGMIGVQNRLSITSEQNSRTHFNVAGPPSLPCGLGRQRISDFVIIQRFARTDADSATGGQLSVSDDT